MGNKNKTQLAINGGLPVRSIPMPPRFAYGDNEKKMVLEVFDYYHSRGIDPGYQGHFEELYCQQFCDYLGGGYADAVATGTVAIYIAIAALDLPAGSEVIVSPVTDPGTISAIIKNDLTPKLVDCAPGSFNIGPKQVAERISNKTKALVVVHVAGRASEMDAIIELCHANGIRVLEDCSQSHGAKWKGRPVGTFGDIAAFSTMYRKTHITGGSGGVVFTTNEDMYHMALAHADRGKPRWKDDFVDTDPSGFLFPALNLHTDELSCAIGMSSLARLPETLKQRLNYILGVSRRIDMESRVCHSYGFDESDSPFICPVFVNADAITCSKREFAEAVRAEGIGLNPHYQYVVSRWDWLQPYLADGFDTPNAKKIQNNSFNLFVNEKYGSAEIDDTVDAILKVEEYFIK